jgi:hypothetical protein
MKKIFLLLFSILLYGYHSFSQTIVVGGQCMSGGITLTFFQNIDGKPAYTGIGTVDGNAGVQVSIYWMPAPDNLWVLDFDGQPYFQNSCNTATVPGTAFTACPWSVVSGTTCTGGAALSITGAVLLPVTMLDFTATKKLKEVLLNWKTSQEINNNGFTVQKSNDGIHWLDIGFVKGNGTTSSISTYQFTDAAPFSGINLYRLKQEDIDGKITYSSTQKVDFTLNSFFTISDNPGKGIYKINMAPGIEKLEILVTDASGKTIVRKTAVAGNHILDISNNASGIYWLQIKKANYQVTQKIIKL